MPKLHLLLRTWDSSNGSIDLPSFLAHKMSQQPAIPAGIDEAQPGIEEGESRYAVSGTVKDHKQSQVLTSAESETAARAEAGNPQSPRATESSVVETEASTTNDGPEAGDASSHSASGTNAKGKAKATDDEQAENDNEEGQPEEQEDNSGSDSLTSWESRYEEWTPENSGYCKVTDPWSGLTTYYWRKPDSFWSGPLKFVRPHDYNSLTYHDWDSGIIFPVFVSGRIDDEYGEMLDEHNLNIDNGRVDGFNIMCSTKPKAEEDETQQDVIGGGSGESAGSGDEELEADWYTIIDPSARRTQGTLCWPANRADLRIELTSRRLLVWQVEALSSSAYGRELTSTGRPWGITTILRLTDWSLSLMRQISTPMARDYEDRWTFFQSF